MSSDDLIQGVSSRSLEIGNSSASRTMMQQEAMEYDRRQIRRNLAEKLKARGLDPEVEMASMDEVWDDEESVYDDTETFPWKQREAAVHAAAVGGKTEGRMEGFDSLERALQAHHHQIHYGRGSGFGWSAQQKSSSRDLRSTQHKLNSMRQLTDWTSFKDLSQTSSEQRDVRDGYHDDDDLEEKHAKETRKVERQKKLLSTLYVLVAIGATAGFAYYIEILKINTYQSYIPSGYTAVTKLT